MQLGANNHITYTSNECSGRIIQVLVWETMRSSQKGGGGMLWCSLGVQVLALRWGWGGCANRILSSGNLSVLPSLSALCIWWTLHSYEVLTPPGRCHVWDTVFLPNKQNKQRNFYGFPISGRFLTFLLHRYHVFFSLFNWVKIFFEKIRHHKTWKRYNRLNSQWKQSHLCWEREL